MFYRFHSIFKFLGKRFSLNLVYALGLIFTVAVILLVFRVFWSFLYRFIDVRPSIGMFELLAGITGIFYGLLWMGIILKALSYLNIEAITKLISGTISARFILPLPVNIYKLITGIGLKIFTSGGVEL